MASLLVTIMAIGACGGATSTPGGAAPTATADQEAEPPAVEPTAATSQPDAQDEGTECSLDAPASCGGAAALTLGDQSIVFDFFACYTGEDAITALDNDDGVFGALGQVSSAGGPSSVTLAGVERLGATSWELAYIPGDAPDTQWHADGESNDMETDGSHFTFDGTFIKVVGDSPTSETVAGSLDATCAS